jgi:hypothetical protein
LDSSIIRGFIFCRAVPKTLTPRFATFASLQVSKARSNNGEPQLRPPAGVPLAHPGVAASSQQPPPVQGVFLVAGSKGVAVTVCVS